MKLSAQEERAARVKRVTLDGKPLALTSIVELDDKEGWVKVALPKTENLQGAFNKEGKVATEQPPEAEFEYRTLHGKVEVLWHD